MHHLRKQICGPNMPPQRFVPPPLTARPPRSTPSPASARPAVNMMSPAGDLADFEFITTDEQERILRELFDAYGVTNGELE